MTSVYFITDGIFTKIGKADSPSKRLSEIQVGNPRPLSIVATLNGDPRLERALQRHFASCGRHVRGEWFRIEIWELRAIEVAAYRIGDGYVDFRRWPKDVASAMDKSPDCVRFAESHLHQYKCCE